LFFHDIHSIEVPLTIQQGASMRLRVVQENYDSQIFSNVEKAIAAFREGKMVILTDDRDRENEGDLIFPAEDVTADKVNFMAKEARGLICLTLAAPIVDRLQLPLMGDRGVGFSSAQLGTAFTLSIEANHGVTTGISAADRAHTIRVAIDDKTKASDIRVPGHVFPLRAREGGVLQRTGHTEGSVDLARLAGKKQAAVICEIMNDDGSMARLHDLEIFGKKHNIPLLSIEDLITYRLAREALVSEIKRVPFSMEKNVQGVWFRSEIDQSVHFALVKGGVFQNADCVDVRVHKQSPLTDIFGTDLCFEPILDSSRWKIDYAVNLIKNRERAVFLHLTNTDPNAMQDPLGLQHMDPRVYGIGAQILTQLGVGRMRLHLTSERTLTALRGFGLEIVDTILMAP
jgi:3,4-dihydroxy 2-butanone 4-phosphate synthase/GTP cyclohydrolase II